MSYALEGGDLTPEDLDRASRDCKIRDEAIKWFQGAAKEIAALAGREATAAEKAIARLVVFAELGAVVYGDARRELGAAVAQGLLKEGFSLLGGVLRRNGEDVVLKVSTEFVQVAANAPDVHYAAAEPEICDCARDEDGRCAECVETLRGFCSRMAESVRVIRESRLSDRKSCRPCILRHMDGVMADFVRREISKFDRDSAESLMKTLFMTSQSIRAMPMPLTMKAWGDVIQGKER